MAYLFKLPIEGMGTPDMESFWSYLVRLSIHHAVPLRRFLATCINIFNYKFESTIRMEWPRHLTEFIRPNSSTERVLTVVECLTDLYDLRATTLISLGNLPRMVDCLEDIPKWCAECLREREEKKMPMYFKLIWNFKDVKVGNKLYMR
jgi:hypothetical protein